MTENISNLFLSKIKNKKLKIGIIGLGYVGLPLARAFCKQKINVIGLDIDKNKVNLLSSGKSYIKHISDNDISKMIENEFFMASTDYSLLKKVDAIIICVPTPLTSRKEPDLEPVLNTARSISNFIQKGQLVILESSTYPGTTDEELSAVLSESGLKKDSDFFLAYSPEREDPGNKNFSTSTIPKIVGADSSISRNLAVSLYESVIEKVIPVSSTRTAEAIKLTENIFRSVNIALMNELKVIFDAMDIDVWDVIEGASTKPFGFMPFYPGPGLGGHCIPIDPFYLSYKANKYNVAARFIELAGEINTNMPKIVVSKLLSALNSNGKRSIKHAKILIIGMAYKKNVDDMRESPSLVLTKLLEALGAKVEYFDNFIPEIPNTRDHNDLAGRKSIKISPEVLKDFDAILISTNHDNIDYQMIADNSKLVIDTRNAMSNFPGRAKVIKA